jgi:hypothetical protein
MHGIYVQTNEPENRVLAFRREEDGGLTPLGEFATGSAGDGVPHLTSQGSVVLTGDGRHLLVTNAGSGDVAVFAVGADGLELVQTAATGSAPKSVAEQRGLVYVLNTGEPSLTGFRFGENGLEPIAGSRRELAAQRGSGAGRLLAGRVGARRHRAGNRRCRRLPRGHGRPARRAAGAAVLGPDTLRLRLRGRHARRHRGVPRRGGQGGRLVVPGQRRRSGARHALGRQRPERDLLGRDDARRPLRVHDELRRRRGTRSTRTGASRSRMPSPASPSRARPACATRASPATARSSTRSTPTLARSSAGE